MPSAPVSPVLAGRYRLGPRLGQGGMGEIYDACDTRLGRDVAVKVLRRDMAARPEIRGRFESEARSAARLSHPHVVTVYDTGEDRGTAFIVMERLPGRTLADVIKSGPVDQQWLRVMAADVLSALAAAHDAGLVHRDVKPGNILLTDDNRAKVADFGIAKSLEPEAGEALDVTAPHLMLGTPSYLAPERVQGRPATPACDIYAVGVVLYEALAGHKPYGGDTPIAVAMAALEGAPEPLVHARPDVDPGLAAVVERAMQPDPDARYATAAQMAAALDARSAPAEVTVDDAPTVAEATSVLRTPPAPVPVRARVRRKQPILTPVITLAVALAIIAGLTWALVSRHDAAHTGNGASSQSVVTTISTVPTTVATVQVQLPVATTPAPQPKHPRRHGKGRG